MSFLGSHLFPFYMRVAGITQVAVSLSISLHVTSLASLEGLWFISGINYKVLLY